MWERKRKIKGEIGYISERNILVWNEIIILKTLNIAKHNRNMKISIFQKTVFREKGTPIYWKKPGGAAAPLAPPASPPLESPRNPRILNNPQKKLRILRISRKP